MGVRDDSCKLLDDWVRQRDRQTQPRSPCPGATPPSSGSMPVLLPAIFFIFSRAGRDAAVGQLMHWNPG
ncbi:MAG: hypothetical protein R2703_06015 [Micropruina glycogenica]